MVLLFFQPVHCNVSVLLWCYGDVVIGKGNILSIFWLS